MRMRGHITIFLDDDHHETQSISRAISEANKLGIDGKELTNIEITTHNSGAIDVESECIDLYWEKDT